MRLMVTDMEFATNSNGTSIGIMARVFIENRTTTTTRTLVAMIGGGGPAGQGGTASPVTGFSVSAGGRIVADALATSQAGYPTTFYTYPQNGTQGYHTILLRGYVVAEE
jgi:hypothetical protein